MIRSTLIGGALIAALATPAHATDIVLGPDGTWNSFSLSDVDSQSAGLEWLVDADSLSPAFGTPVFFSFTVAADSQALFTVVDAAFAGDTFFVFNDGVALGHTSAVPTTTYPSAPNVLLDFDAAFANPAFSNASFLFGPGSYRIAGALDQSVMYEDGSNLNSTVGGVRLMAVLAVPEPSAMLAMLAGFGVVAGALRTRRQRCEGESA